MTGKSVIIGVWIIIVYTFLTDTTVSSQNASVTTPAPQSSPSMCPTFPVKQENRTLTFIVIPNQCELKVRVRVVMRNSKFTRSLSFLKGRGVKPNVRRNLHLTEVEMVLTETTTPVGVSDNMTTETPATCPDYRIRNIGLLTVIDTVRNVCQLVVGVQRIDINNTPRTTARERFDFVPVFQYLEENIFR